VDVAEPNLREKLVAVLIEQVANDRYPSTTMMDQIEYSLTPSLHERYVMVLMDKIASDRYPSVDLTRRVAGLVR
jgi:hypothetical protein